MLPTPDCRIPPVLDIQKRGVAAVMSQSPASPFSFDLATTSTDAVHAWKPLDSQTADPQWRRRTFLRREWVLEHLLHAAAPEEYPPTEQDGSKEEAYEIVECNRESIAPSDTYQELLNLRLDPSQLDEVESAQADDGEWEMVPGRKKGEDVDYEFLAFAVPGLGPKKLATESAVSLQEVKPRTQGRGGRGRSSLMQDGGRGRGRGRNRGRVQNACNSGNREQAKIEREPQSRLHTEDGGNRVLVVPLKPRAAEHHQQDASHPRASSNNRGGRRGRGYSRGRGGRLEGKGFVEDGSQDALQMHDKRPDSMRGHSRHLRGGYRSPAHEKDLDPASSGRGRGSRGGYRGRGRGRGRGIGERRMPAIQEKNVSDPHQEQSTTME